MTAGLETSAGSKLQYGLISVDDHVQEPPDLWTSRLSGTRFAGRVPQLQRAADGTEHWVLDGNVLLDGQVSRAAALMADRNHEATHWGDVPAAAYQSHARLEAMDHAGVDRSALYPTVAGLAGEAFASLSDPELELACVQAYNDWLIDEWAAASERFIPQCILPVWPVEAAVLELQRSVARGHRGVVFPSVPMDLRDVPHPADPDWDPLWSACEDAGVPLCLHAGGSPKLQNALPPGLSPTLAAALDAVQKPVSTVYVVGLVLFSRVLMRHPKLKVVFAESALSWTMLYLEWADHQAEHDGLSREGYELTPSEMFRRQCYVDAWYDSVAPFAPYVGADRILWSTNIPLATSSWPQTRDEISRCFEGVSELDRERVLWRNAAELYGLNVTA